MLKNCFAFLLTSVYLPYDRIHLVSIGYCVTQLGAKVSRDILLLRPSQQDKESMSEIFHYEEAESYVFCLSRC